MMNMVCFERSMHLMPGRLMVQDIMDPIDRKNLGNNFQGVLLPCLIKPGHSVFGWEYGADPMVSGIHQMKKKRGQR